MLLLPLLRRLPRLPHDPLAAPALRAAAAATGLILLAACVGAGVRLLPWVLDPSIPSGSLGPFAKSLLSVGVEAALLIGWPVGWALAVQRLVDRGEARVLAALGEAPPQTLLRLVPQSALLGGLLVVFSVLLARDAQAPGKVVNALLAEGRASCGPAPSTKGVPFVAATWLCGDTPRLVGKAPIGGVLFTAEGARVSDDLRRIELDRARLAISSAHVRVHVDTLVLAGMAPWARASSLAPALRALLVALSAFGAACLAVIALLRSRRTVGSVASAAVGAAGPLAALVSLRAIELRLPDHVTGLWLAAVALVPAAALVSAFVAGWVVTALPERRGADSK
jgi:hypothetical protein